MAGTSWPTLLAGARAKASEVESKFDWVEQDFVPMSAGTKTDAAYDLGASGFRWRDIYFSRQVLAPNTAVSAPPYAFANNTGMGWYRIGNNNLGGAVSGTKFWDVSSAGEITAPLQPAFFATNDSNLGSEAYKELTTGTGNVMLTMTSELFDNNSDYNNATGYFTAPKTGIYQFAFKCQLEQLTTTANMTFSQQLRIISGGTTTALIRSAGFATPNGTLKSYAHFMSELFSLSSGDTVNPEITFTSDSATSQSPLVKYSSNFTGTARFINTYWWGKLVS